MPAWPYPWQNVKNPLLIPSGALRHQISIQAEVVGGFGTASTWSTIYKCFAAIDTVSMREVYQEGFVSQTVHRITVRWPGKTVNLNASMQVVTDTSTYQIQAVENVQNRNLVVHLTCLEINPQGQS